MNQEPNADDAARAGGGDAGDAAPQRSYPVMIDKRVHVFTDPMPTGRELLTTAGKLPVEQFAIYLKPPGAQPKRVGLDEQVDLRAPGVERFVTLPLDQTEGLGGQRRQFALPAEDMEWLEELGSGYELVSEGGSLRVVLNMMELPAGYRQTSAAANVRIEPGYPDTQIDMVYFYPGLALVSGRAIDCVCDDAFDGRNWQRWSRHRTPANPWRPGIDGLATHFTLVREWLEREARKAA